MPSTTVFRCAGMLGYALTLTGVFLYSEAKRRTKAPPTAQEKLESKSSALPAMLNAAIGDATVVVNITSSSANHRESPRSTPRKDAAASDTAKAYFKDILYRHHERLELGEERAIRVA